MDEAAKEYLDKIKKQNIELFSFVLSTHTLLSSMDISLLNTSEFLLFGELLNKAEELLKI